MMITPLLFNNPQNWWLLDVFHVKLWGMTTDISLKATKLWLVIFLRVGMASGGWYFPKFPCQSELSQPFVRITEWHGSNRSLAKKLTDVSGMRFPVQQVGNDESDFP